MSLPFINSFWVASGCLQYSLNTLLLFIINSPAYETFSSEYFSSTSLLLWSTSLTLTPGKGCPTSPGLLYPSKGLLRIIPVSVIPYLSSNSFPEISFHFSKVLIGRLADPETINLNCLHDYLISVYFCEDCFS